MARLQSGSALVLGIALLPMGEFNIVLGNASFIAGRLNRLEMALLVAASMATIAFAALLTRGAEGRRLIRDRVSEEPQRFSVANDVVVVGYGRVGRTVARMLQQEGVSIAVIERDASLVRQAQAEGFEAAYGDGGDPHVLEHLISPHTRVVLVTIPDSQLNAAEVRWLRGKRNAAIVVRAERAADVPELLRSGAAAALVPEVEGARAFGRAVLEALRP